MNMTTISNSILIYINVCIVCAIYIYRMLEFVARSRRQTHFSVVAAEPQWDMHVDSHAMNSALDPKYIDQLKVLGGDVGDNLFETGLTYASTVSNMQWFIWNIENRISIMFSIYQLRQTAMRILIHQAHSVNALQRAVEHKAALIDDVVEQFPCQCIFNFHHLSICECMRQRQFSELDRYDPTKYNQIQNKLETKIIIKSSKIKCKNNRKIKSRIVIESFV